VYIKTKKEKPTKASRSS